MTAQDVAGALATLSRALGDTRTDAEMAKDGARRTLSLIDKLRNQLRMAERDCQHVLSTGNALKDSDAIWKRVAKASDKLLDGMTA